MIAAFDNLPQRSGKDITVNGKSVELRALDAFVDPWSLVLDDARRVRAELRAYVVDRARDLGLVWRERDLALRSEPAGAWWWVPVALDWFYWRAGLLDGVLVRRLAQTWAPPVDRDDPEYRALYDELRAAIPYQRDPGAPLRE